MALVRYVSLDAFNVLMEVRASYAMQSIIGPRITQFVDVLRVITPIKENVKVVPHCSLTVIVAWPQCVKFVMVISNG